MSNLSDFLPSAPTTIPVGGVTQLFSNTAITTLDNYLLASNSVYSKASNLDVLNRVGYAEASVLTPLTSNTNTTFNSIIYGGGLYVAAGVNGVIRTSTDGITWDTRTSGTASTIESLAYGNGVYLYCGFGGNFATSTDAITWTNRALIPEEGVSVKGLEYYKVDYNNGKYYIFGEQGILGTSTNAVTWYIFPRVGGNDIIGTASNLNAIAYGNGRYVAIGGQGRSSTDFYTWDSNVDANFTGPSPSGQALVYAQGLFVGIGDNGSIFTSTDAINLGTNRLTPVRDFAGLDYGNGLFVTIADNGTELYTSTNAITWTARTFLEFTTQTPNIVRSLKYSNGLYMIVGSGGRFASSTNGITWDYYPKEIQVTNLTSSIIRSIATGIANTAAAYVAAGNGGVYGTSTNGFTWATRTSGTSSQISSITYANNGIYVYGGVNGTLASSTDGITWIQRTSKTTAGIDKVRYTQGLYVFTAGSTLGTSTNGTTVWEATDRTIDSLFVNNNNLVDDIAYANGIFIAVSNENTGLVSTSTDGLTWTARTAATNTNLNATAYGNSLYLIAGTAGSIQSSTNGITWTARANPLSTSSTKYNIFSVNYDSVAKFILGGQSGAIGTSTDGITWNAYPNFTTVLSSTVMNSIVYGNGQFVKAGNLGVIRTSTDGITWTARTSGTSSVISHLALTGTNTYVAVGANGLALSSTNAITWTARNSRVVVSLQSGLTYGNGFFVAGTASGEYGTSTDGITWNQYPGYPPFGDSFNITAVAYSTSTFLYAGAAGAARTSTDGFTWTARTTGSATALTGAAYGNSTWVVVGLNGAVFTSTNAVTWTKRTTAVVNAAVVDVAYNPGSTTAAFTYVGNSGIVATSTNAITWVARTSATASTLEKIIFANNLYVAAGTNGALQTSTDGITWTARTSNFASTEIRTITYGNGKYLIAGDNRTWATSTDAVTWTLGTSSALNGIAAATEIYASAYEQGYYILAGDGGDISYSTDAVTWVGLNYTTASSIRAINSFGGRVYMAGVGGMVLETENLVARSETSSAINDLTYGNGTYVMVGDGGMLRTSTDLISWTARTSGTSSAIAKVRYDNGIYVFAGTNLPPRYSTDAVTWATSTGIAATNDFTNLFYNDGQYIAMGINGLLFTSTNAITWEQRTNGSGVDGTAMAYGNGAYVKIGGNGQVDFIRGSFFGSGTTIQIDKAVYLNGKYVIIGNNGLYRTSTDGAYWDSVATTGLTTSGDIVDIDYLNGVWLAATTVGVVTSTNGITWTTFTTKNSGRDFLYSEGRWLIGFAGSTADTGLYTTTDLSSFASGRFERLSGSSTGTNFIVYGNDSYVLVNSQLNKVELVKGTFFGAYNTSTGFNDATYGNNLHCLVGSNGLIRTSTDGKFWEQQTSATFGTSTAINSVIYSNGLFVAVGVAGKIATSTNAITWTDRTSGTTRTIPTVIYANGFYVAGTDNGEIVFTSTNAITWIQGQSAELPSGRPLDVIVGETLGDGYFYCTSEDSLGIRYTKDWNLRRTASQLYAVTYGNGVFAIAGSQGALATSTNGYNWTTRTFITGPTEETYGALFSENTHIFVDGAGYIKTTTDFVTWREYATDGSVPLFNIRYENSEYYMSGDGRVYRAKGTFFGSGIGTINASNFSVANTYVIAGVGPQIATSTDGYSWTQQTPAIELNNTIQDVGYGNGIFVAVAASGGGGVGLATSTNGITWSTVSTVSLDATSGTLYGISYANGLYVTVGTSGLIGTSTNGTNWMFKDDLINGVSNTIDLNSIIYNNGKFYIAGESGKLATTTDAQTFAYSPLYDTSTALFIPEVNINTFSIPNNYTLKTDNTYETVFVRKT